MNGRRPGGSGGIIQKKTLFKTIGEEQECTEWVVAGRTMVGRGGKEFYSGEF